MSDRLRVENLHVSIDGKEILSGVNLCVPPGEVHAVMGPNGSGKSTLANVIMGDNRYQVSSGEIYFDGEGILDKPTDERARMGLFLSFQYPVAIPGIPLSQLVRKSSSLILGKRAYPSLRSFSSQLEKAQEITELPEEMLARAANDGFSGGEKKKAEALQMQVLMPRFVMLDEIDSGLDIDALNSIARAVNGLRAKERSFLIITHYQRILSLIRPHKVHVMKRGRVVRSGDAGLVEELERSGYVDIMEVA